MLMRAATYTQGGAFAIQDVGEPEIGDGELILRVRAAAICGTDIKITRHGHRRLRGGQRIVLGHEVVAEIAEVCGPTNGYCVGQRVGVAPNVGCGHCECCAQGKTNYCLSYEAIGVTLDGAHAEYVRLPAAFAQQGNLIPLPESLSDRDAAVLEPLSCVVSGVRAARVSLGDTVAIYGAGPIGILHALVCARAGATWIAVIDPIDDRLERARLAGADLTLSPERADVVTSLREATDGRGVDVAITACPVAEAQVQALASLATFGRLCLFGGLPCGAEEVRLDTNAVHYRGLTVTGTTGGSVDDYRAAMRLAASGKLPLKLVVSDEFPLPEMARAYETALAGAAAKVVLLN
jgi:threonine dehydrogenase-like Zn-dependent dehydrogenase